MNKKGRRYHNGKNFIHGYQYSHISIFFCNECFCLFFSYFMLFDQTHLKHVSTSCESDFLERVSINSKWVGYCTLMVRWSIQIWDSSSTWCIVNSIWWCKLEVVLHRIKIYKFETNMNMYFNLRIIYQGFFFLFWFRDLVSNLGPFLTKWLSWADHWLSSSSGTFCGMDYSLHTNSHSL